MIAQMHNIVEGALDAHQPGGRQIAIAITATIRQISCRCSTRSTKRSQSIMYIGDKENSNADSALVSTRRSLIFNQLNKQLYQKFFLTVEELQAAARRIYLYPRYVRPPRHDELLPV